MQVFLKALVLIGAFVLRDVLDLLYSAILHCRTERVTGNDVREVVVPDVAGSRNANDPLEVKCLTRQELFPLLDGSHSCWRRIDVVRLVVQNQGPVSPPKKAVPYGRMNMVVGCSDIL